MTYSEKQEAMKCEKCGAQGVPGVRLFTGDKKGDRIIFVCAKCWYDNVVIYNTPSEKD